jgi:hypothetical protein
MWNVAIPIPTTQQESNKTIEKKQKQTASQVL